MHDTSGWRGREVTKLDTEEQFEVAQDNLAESRRYLDEIGGTVNTPWLWSASLPLGEVTMLVEPKESCQLPFCVFCLARNVPFETTTMVPDDLHYPGIQLMCQDGNACLARMHHLYHESGDWPECTLCTFNL
jgi:hypothetical protein